MKRILALLLVLALVFGLAACKPSEPADKPVVDESKKPDETKTDNPDTTTPDNKPEQREAKGSITYGSTTDLSGDFFTTMWGNNASDALVKGLIHGYTTVTYQKETGSYEIDKTVVKELKAISNADGSKTFEIEINNDLVYSDGSPVKAKDYVFGILLLAHPDVADIGGDTTGPEDYVGYDDYSKRPEGSETGQVSDTFAGVRLLGDYKFSATVKSEKLPYFYELIYASFGPVPMAVIAPNADIVDEGKGAKIVGEFNSELLEKTINDPDTGYRFNPKVTSGPYMLDSFDRSTKIAILKVNPNYKGDYNGHKAQIAEIIIKKVVQATQIDELIAGQVDVLGASGGKDLIEPGLDAVDEGKISVTTFPRSGYGKIVFVCDLGPTQFLNVRHAIAHCLDVPEFARQYSGGYASVVYGMYGVAHWMYQENAATIDKEFNKYALDLGKAKQLLIDDGWTLNEKGEPFVEGVDAVRAKRLEDGTLMPLVIKHLASENNAVSTLLATMLPENLAAIGAKYEQTIVDFPTLLNNLYGQVPERQYNMMNLATNFSAVFDPYNSFRLEDEYMGVNNQNFLRDQELVDLAEAMKLTPGDDREGYSKKWLAFQKRWNYLLPDLPLYSDEYHSFISNRVKNFEVDPFWTFQRAILYAYVED